MLSCSQTDVQSAIEEPEPSLYVIKQVQNRHLNIYRTQWSLQNNII